jgi:glycosyltransferase involved in cell wall biosynthesis
MNAGAGQADCARPGGAEGLPTVKVLMQARVSLFTVPGGDTVQIVETARALRRHGVDAQVTADLNADPRGYDLAHLFNLGRVQESAHFARGAVDARVPVVLSPIYWDTSEFERRGHSGGRAVISRMLPLDVTERLRGAWRYFVNGERNPATRRLIVRGWRRLQRYVLSVSSCLLPNSAAELELLRREFGPLSCAAIVVPNGVSPEFGETREHDRSGVACVGRIEPRKNQLGLVRALRETDYDITLVGAAAPNHERYLKRVLHSGGARVKWLKHMTHAEIRQVLAGSKVHALPSWFETPGLASLEAAAAGCAIVVSDRGSTREYFGTDAHYCDPADEASIRGAVARAYDSPGAPGLREKVLTTLTWDAAAERTLRAYHLALGGGPPSGDLLVLPTERASTDALAPARSAAATGTASSP